VERPKRLLEPLKIPLKTMTGPGPSNMAPRVRDACSLPPIGVSFLHDECPKLLTDIVAGLQYLFQTRNEVTLCISATGHGGMEAICCNILDPGDLVVVCINGLWGERFEMIADRHGAAVKTITKPLGQSFSLDELEKVLLADKPKLMFITYGESTGGTLQPLEGIGELCHRYGSLFVVDAVAAAGGVPLYMDKWGIDVLYTGSQKVLGAPPGLTPISFSQRAWECVLNRRTKIRSYLFDMTELVNVWGCDGKPPPAKYHHTVSTSTLYALREALALLAEEGLENVWQRHKQCMALFHTGLEQLGLKLLVRDALVRLPTITTIEIPDDIADWQEVCRYAMNEYKVEISGGLGRGAGKVWRIGLMGYNANPDTVQLVLKVLGESLDKVRMQKHYQAKV